MRGIAREWHGKQLEGWTETHAVTVMRRLERDVFPYIGNRPIAEIEAPELLAMIHAIEKRGALDVAHRAKQTSGQIFRYLSQLFRNINDRHCQVALQ